MKVFPSHVQSTFSCSARNLCLVVPKKLERNRTCLIVQTSYITHGAVCSTTCVLSGRSDDSEDTLRRLVQEALHMMMCVPENADGIIAEICDDIDAWVEEDRGGRLNMDLLTRIQRGEFFFPECTDANGQRDELVERVGARLTMHYVGCDFGSLDEDSLRDNKNTIQVMSKGNLVPSRSVDLKLLEEQARALEATIGVQKAQSLVELLGRKTLSAEERNRIKNIPQKRDAERVLEVLVCVEDRRERCSVMKEAFIPVSEDDDNMGDEEAISTTPMALYQEIISWQGKYEDGTNIEIMADLPQQQVQEILQELREDVFDSLQQ